MIALFRAVLLLCPPAFRREYGAAMCDDFALALADERTVHGLIGALTYAIGAMWDLFTTALREYAAMFFRDFTYALRALRKTPSFTAVVVATLALAIGANAAVFSILHAVVLAPIPYADPGRLIALNPYTNGRPFSFSLPNFADISTSLGDLISNSASYTSVEAQTLTGRGEPRILKAIATTSGLFETLGVSPELGRFATADDAKPGSPKTVVLSDALWREAFDADPHAIGSLARLNGEAYRVIGVAPPDFRQPNVDGRGFEPADIWTPLPRDGAGTQYSRGYNTFEAIARLRPGVTLGAANTSIDRIVAGLQRRYPDDDALFTVHAVSLTDSIVGNVRPLLFALFAAVSAVLLVACANVANLLLSRASSREREFSVRVAIGASRGRIVAQLLVETFVLALGGGAIGIALAYGIVGAFAASHISFIPRADLVSVDGSSILYTFAIVGFCTLAAGLAPAFDSARRDVATALRSAGRGGDASSGARARNVLVASEIAMTLALVIGAGLVVRSFVALTAQPLGFVPENVRIVGPVNAAGKRYESDAALYAYMTRAERAVAALPGVRNVAWSYSIPFNHHNWSTDFMMEGRTFAAGHEPEANITGIGASFFDALGATIREGRPFTSDERAPVVIVNESFVRKFIGDRAPIGFQVKPSISAGSGAPPFRTIVGVVDDIKTSLTTPTLPTIYVPMADLPVPASSLVVRSSAGASSDATIANAVVAIDSLVPRPQVVAMSSLLAADVAKQRLTVAALCGLAFVALALSIAGVFAVVSYGVTQRTHEFGIRMALGADARQIVRTVLVGAMRLAFLGIVLGLFVAGAGTRLLTDELYDTQPLDPLTFGSVTALVVLAALVAALVPARRATQVDPIVALRYE
jgi:putative ABC transport system permease protein